MFKMIYMLRSPDREPLRTRVMGMLGMGSRTPQQTESDASHSQSANAATSVRREATDTTAKAGTPLAQSGEVWTQPPITVRDVDRTRQKAILVLGANQR